MSFLFFSISLDESNNSREFPGVVDIFAALAHTLSP
jgi:hypothetical protein